MLLLARAAFVTAALVALAAGCSRGGARGGTPEMPAGEDLRPIQMPDLSRVDPSVREQAWNAHAALAARLKAGAGDAELAAAYGALGMVLQAADYYDAAEPNLLNAQMLAPTEVRWPYYLGHLHQTRGRLGDAKTAFGRALTLRGDDLATLVWLGRIHYDEGDLQQAQEFFTRAHAIAPDAVAVLAGLGRVALGRRDHARAVQYFERALAIDPEGAESLHAPLAVAYRAAGNTAAAQRHEHQWVNRDILVPDPLSQELDMLLDNGLSNELRGVRALDAKDWATAARYFERGLAVTPDNTPLRRSLQHKLGTALYLGGETERAAAQFEQVVQAAPAAAVDEATAKAYYSLGVILMAARRHAEAIRHFDGAVRYQPTYVEARLALAEAMRRTGQVGPSVPHYEAVLELTPAAAEASLGYSLALIRLGRYRNARDQLDQAVQAHPDRPEFAHTLARLLAVAPDDRVRDGQRALLLLDDLLQGTRTTELGETLAMALAEVGEYERAAAIQRDILAVVRRGGMESAAPRLERNLRQYERGRPVRTFWEGDGPG